MEQKVCIHCGESLDLDLFVTDSRNIETGKSNVCKSCKKIQVNKSSRYKDYKAKHKKQYSEDFEYRELMKKRAAKFRNENNSKVLVSQAKARSSKFQLDFNIDISDIIIPTHCPILNIKLSRGNGVKSNSSPSLDRIDNCLGYIRGNVRVISNLANSMKRDATKEQLLMFAKNIENYLNDDIV